jgi:hypothetical protein
LKPSILTSILFWLLAAVSAALRCPSPRRGVGVISIDPATEPDATPAQALVQRATTPPAVSRPSG